MAKESDPRRRAIAAAICGAGVQAVVYDAGRRHPDELSARAACLAQLVADVAGYGESVVVLEQDDSLLEWDRRQLYRLTRDSSTTAMRYEHRRARSEHLLAIPDALAWCWARGGDWRRRIAPAIADIRSV